jgi:O-antigen ligase
MFYILYNKQRFRLKITTLDFMVIIFFIWRIITNPSYFKDAIQILWLLSLLFLILIVRQMDEDESHHFINLLIIVIFWGGIFQASIGLMQIYFYPSQSSLLIKTPVIGSIGLPNAFGSFMALSCIAALVKAINSQKLLFRIFYLILMAFMLSLLIINGSRGAFLALLIAAIVILTIYLVQKNSLLRYYLQRQWICSMLLGCAVISLSIISIILFNINPESAKGRIMITKISLPMFFENPLMGIGYGNYSKYYLDYQAKFYSYPENQNMAYKAANLKQAHNEFLEIFCETGIIGGIIFFLIVVVAYKMLYNRFKSPRNDSVSITNLFLVAVLLITLIHGLVDDTLHFFPTNILFFVVLDSIQGNYFKITVFLEQRKYALGASILFILLSLYAAYHLYNQYMGYRFWAAAHKQKYPAIAVTYYEKALHKLPDKGELLFHYGSALALKGNYTRGLHFLERSLESYNDRNIYLSMSYAYMKLYNFDKAEAFAKKALSMFPDHLAPHLLLGQVYFRKKEFDLSKASLKKCIDLNTHIMSDDVLQIRRDAVNLWQRYYGNL